MIKENPIKKGDFRRIGSLIGESHPFKISYHINRLIKNNFIYTNKDGLLCATILGQDNNRLFSIPVLGEASCGIPNIFAEINFAGYIQVSKKLLEDIDDIKNIVAVKAFGNSMNKAIIGGKNVEEGDYVLVDLSKTKGSQKYVLAVHNGCAVIKRLYKNEKEHIYSLVSESTEKHPPIFINPDEADDTFVNGYVLDVIKKPKDSECENIIEPIEED